MRKIIIGLSGLLIVAFVAIKVVNAQTSAQEVKKNATEQKMDCEKCPSAETCAHKTDAKTCDPAKCKEGKRDTTKCKAKCDGATAEKKNCQPAKCGGTEKK